jgi:hypothetical protein
MSFNVKNGTPMHGPSLCETCDRAHIFRGYRENELIVVCGDVRPAAHRTVPGARMLQLRGEERADAVRDAENRLEAGGKRTEASRGFRVTGRSERRRTVV